MATTKRFHRHYDVPGLPLYWIIIAYIIIGWFWPVIGLLALICMIGPVLAKVIFWKRMYSHVASVGCEAEASE